MCTRRWLRRAAAQPGGGGQRTGEARVWLSKWATDPRCDVGAKLRRIVCQGWLLPHQDLHVQRIVRPGPCGRAASARTHARASCASIESRRARAMPESPGSLLSAHYWHGDVAAVAAAAGKATRHVQGSQICKMFSGDLTHARSWAAQVPLMELQVLPPACGWQATRQLGHIPVAGPRVRHGPALGLDAPGCTLLLGTAVRRGWRPVRASQRVR